MFRASASILSLLVLSISVLAQTPEPTANREKSETRGTISGRVVNENGGPVANALVYASKGNPPTSQTTYTDHLGVFRIGDLEPGEYNMSARAPAYITPPPDRAGRWRNPNARPGDSVTLTLFKGGVITGRVLDAAGQPVVWVSVSALIIGDDEGRVYPSGFRRGIETLTDDRGVYRIYGLQPGTYVVSAGGKSELDRSSMFINAFEHDIATYAPSSYREEAAEIKVRVGEEAIADIRYRAEQGRTVSGEVKVPPNTGTRFSVVLTVAGEGETRWQSEYHPPTDTQNFVFNGVRDGDYEIFAQTYTQSGERGASEEKRISVRGADVSGIVLTAKQLGSITGKLLVEEPTAPECTNKERSLPHQTSIAAWHNENAAAAKLTPQSVWSMRRPVQPDAQGNFILQNLAAGEYSFGTRIEPRYWYFRSVVFTPPVVAGAKTASKPVDATRAWINVKAGDKLSGYTLTLGHGAGLLRGQIEVGEGEAIPQRLIVYLVPAERERADEALRFAATNVGSEGQFAFDNIAPGRYWVIAEPRAEGVTLPLSHVRYPNEGAMRSRLRREAEILKNELEFKPCQEIGHFKLPLKPTNQ